jgi:hypothetical protein
MKTKAQQITGVPRAGGLSAIGGPMKRFASRIKLRTLADELGHVRYLGMCGACREQFVSPSTKVLWGSEALYCERCAVLFEQGFAACVALMGVESVDLEKDTKHLDAAGKAGFHMAFDVWHGWGYPNERATSSGLKAAYVPRGGW